MRLSAFDLRVALCRENPRAFLLRTALASGGLGLVEVLDGRTLNRPTPPESTGIFLVIAPEVGTTIIVPDGAWQVLVPKAGPWGVGEEVFLDGELRHQDGLRPWRHCIAVPAISLEAGKCQSLILDFHPDDPFVGRSKEEAEALLAHLKEEAEPPREETPAFVPVIVGKG